MKKFFISMSLLIVLALPSTAFADNQEIVITEAEDGCYYETIVRVGLKQPLRVRRF